MPGPPRCWTRRLSSGSPGRHLYRRRPVHARRHTPPDPRCFDHGTSLAPASQRPRSDLLQWQSATAVKVRRSCSSRRMAARARRGTRLDSVHEQGLRTLSGSLYQSRLVEGGAGCRQRALLQVTPQVYRQHTRGILQTSVAGMSRDLCGPGDCPGGRGGRSRRLPVLER